MKTIKENMHPSIAGAIEQWSADGYRRVVACGSPPPAAICEQLESADGVALDAIGRGPWEADE